MAVKLTVTPPGSADPDRGSERFAYTFDQEKIVIGRGPSADVRLPSAAVSETHCVVRLEGQDYVLFDPGSTNGTKLNGQGVVEGRRKLLRSGDVIDVSGFQIVFRGGLAMEGVHTAERTAALARRMVREALEMLGPAGEAPRFTAVNGSRTGERIAIADHAAGFVIGRDAECQIPIDDSDASRRHARVRRTWEGTFVSDLESKNGTFVNDEPVRGERRLRDRDELLVGATRFVYEDPAEAYLRSLELVERDAEAASLVPPPRAMSPGAVAVGPPPAPAQDEPHLVGSGSTPRDEAAVSWSSRRSGEAPAEDAISGVPPTASASSLPASPAADGSAPRDGGSPRVETVSRTGDVLVVLLGVAILVGAIAALIVILR